MSWNSGYITELDYTRGHYRALSPDVLRFTCLAAGVMPPVAEPLHYLELGFGHGLSINIHAAACEGEFWGNDFNPGQAAGAQALAAACGSGARLVDDSFAELAARPDLPDFDIIALHGIWTWISEENRTVVIDLIRRKLRVGGIVYLSYNCFPGLGAVLPIRHLLRLHASASGANPRGLLGKVDDALAFANEIAAAGAFFFKANPVATDRLRSIESSDRHYVAHEYLNDAWGVTFFSDLVDRLSPAKLSFATSADILDLVDVVNLSPEAIKLLGGIADPVLRESVRDYFVDNQFRRDIFVKGRRPLNPLEQMERLAAESLVMTWPLSDLPQHVLKAGRKTPLPPELFHPLAEVLVEDDYAPKRVATLVERLAPRGFAWPRLLEAIIVLVGLGVVQPARLPTAVTKRRCELLNRQLCEAARGGEAIGFLASPVLGSGLSLSRFQLLFLLAAQHGHGSPAEQAGFAWDVMRSRDERVLKDGAPLQSAEENIAELTQQAESFAAEMIPILKSIGIA